jgi:4-alpha-glucanotransferase
MQRFKLAIGLHNHQPVGNFDSVFDEAHNNAYMPFLKLFEQFEGLRISLHQSGILWKWQEKRYPEYFDIVQKLLYEDRLELMTGGFYEPILPSIPDRDKIGQIEMLSRYIEGRFGADTSGLWLTERVWEPHLPKILKIAGIDYIPIDDTHFLYAGFELDQLNGIYLTEEEGYTLKLLPIQKKLRYLIPFGKVEKVIDELKRQAEKNPEGLAIYADDGEKFGVWPNTYQHCYTDGWLENFFTALEKNSDWLEVCTLGEASHTEPAGRAYLPTASYAEMLQWSLPPQAYVEFEDFTKWLQESGKFKQYGRFVRGGHWRGFLAKYDEANLMHKKMLSVSEKLYEYSESSDANYESIEKAKHHVYAGQCNCPYWHGVFGGLYLSHIRSAIYENLIKAENFLTSKSDQVEKRVYDYDCDGYDEIVVSTNKFTTLIKPSSGGMLMELDNREAAMNVTDTLTRRREGYHRKLAEAKLSGQKPDDSTESIHDMVVTKEDGLNHFLTYDWHLKRCFIDHFFPADVDPAKFASGDFGDDGDFVLEPWQYLPGTDNQSVHLKREGHLWRPAGVKPLILNKVFYFGPDSEVIAVNYCLTATEDDIPNVRFAVENNFNFLAGHSDDRYILFDGQRKENSYLDALNTQSDCRAVLLRDDWRKIAVGLSTDRTGIVWQTPIFTISLSEGGFEKVYQGTTIVNLFNFDLTKGQPLEITFYLFSGKPENLPPRMNTSPPSKHTISK